MSTPEPSTIRPPPSLAAFHHPSLKFLCLGRYFSGLAGEKEKVVCIIKPNIVIASVRGTLTKQMALSTIVSIHHQDSTDFLPSEFQNENSSGGATPSSLSREKTPGETVTYCDIVITDIDKQVLAFTIPKHQLFSFLGVALHYAPPNTPVHHVRGKVSLLESLASLTRRSGDDVFGSFIQSLQHLGQDDRLERLQSVRTYDAATRKHHHSAATLSSIMTSVAESSPMDEGLPELLSQLQANAVDRDTDEADSAPRAPGVAPLRLTSSPKALPKPRPKLTTGSPERAVMADSYARGIEHLARHKSAPQYKLSILAKALPLPGDDELLAWKGDVPGAAETTLIMPSRAALNVSSLARPIFGQGGTIVFPSTTKEQVALARREELQTVAGVMAELKRMQNEIAEIKKVREPNLVRGGKTGSPPQAAAARYVASSDDDDDDEGDSDLDEAQPRHPEPQQRKPVSPTTLRSVSASSSSAAASTLAGSAPRDQQQRRPVASRSVCSPRSSPRERPVTDTVADNVRSSLLPLLSASTQQAAVRALDELSTIQRELEETSKVHMNPFVLRQIEAMKQPLRTLHRLVAPAQRAVGAADSIDQLQTYAALSGDLVPVWALVDFGEVNYDHMPLMLKQYHRLIARKVDDEGVYHIMIATRMQFAADEGYILVPFSSIVDIALGALPRPVRAQRLTVDGRTGNSDEFLDSKGCLSLRTRLQHILFQFESVEDCRQWVSVLQEVVLENKRGGNSTDRSALRQPLMVDKEDL